MVLLPQLSPIPGEASPARFLCLWLPVWHLGELRNKVATLSRLGTRASRGGAWLLKGILLEVELGGTWMERGHLVCQESSLALGWGQ